eukprot:gene16319-16132_t
MEAGALKKKGKSPFHISHRVYRALLALAIFHVIIFLIGGPVANLVTFRTDDEAVQLANTSQGGLAAAVISPNVGRALALGQRLRAGMVHINDQTVNDECINPFGGPGLGGNGSSVGGPADMDEYTQWQWITVKDAPPAFPF